MGYKTLVIDYDPQSNLTSLMMLTKDRLNKSGEDVEKIDHTLMKALDDHEDLNDIVINITDNFDLIPNSQDFYLYGRYLDKQPISEQEKVSFFSKIIDRDLRGKYDFIFLDVSPTRGLMNDTAYFACDYMAVVLQTQKRALDGAEDLINYIQGSIIDRFDSKAVVLGVLPVLSQKGARIDNLILDMAREKWGEDVFNTHIHLMQRVKSMDVTGITDNPHDTWDRKSQKLFANLAKELVERIDDYIKKYGEGG